ncbi:MAG: hypothetical protein ACE5OO_06685 [Candidatus Bathyarchaeia archaeon]
MIQPRDKVVLLSHCILNQATRAWWEGGGASRGRGMLGDVVEVLLRHGVGAVQMECPEFSLYGNPRPPKSKEGYDTPEFKKRCREIAHRACDLMARCSEGGEAFGIEVLAVIGVENSPSCGVTKVSRPVGGERISRPGRGHLIDALMDEMQRRGLVVPMIGVSLKPEDREASIRELEALCSREP